MNIAEKLFVSIDYHLSLESGEKVDSSIEGQPLGFVTGTGRIIPGLESALMGKAPGESLKVTLEPAEAYGEIDPGLLQEIPKSSFPADAEITPGMSFQAQSPRGPVKITVTAINDNDTVTVDRNHPLAGKRLFFDVKVVEVREPLAEELTPPSADCGCGSSCDSDCGPDSSGEKDCGSGSGSGCACG
jgi:FKBP-type peptidyl-prolyl cis-trans isomerase SlyD